MTTKEKRQRRVQLAEQAQAILTKAEEEKRECTAEELTEFNKIHDEIDTLGRQVEAEERQEQIARALAQPNNPEQIGRDGADDDPNAGGSRADAEARETRDRAFTNFLRFGTDGLDAEQRQLVAQMRTELPPELRAQSTVNAAGGYTIAEDSSFRDTLERAMLAFGGMREACTVLPTGTGATLPMPTSNDTGNEGEIINENTQHNEQDIVFGVVNLGAYTFSSKIVRVSLQLMQDSAINVDQLVAEMLAERLFRITNRKLTRGLGSGSSEPLGLVNAAAAGITFAAAAALTDDELVDLEHSVDPAYRPGARWMFHDNTLRDIKKLKDNDGRYLWKAGLAGGEPDTINNYPYTINQHVSPMDGAQRSVVFGQLTKYIIRDVREVTLLRLTERYADYLQVGFLAFMRSDGNLLDAGSNPVKYGIHTSG